MAVAKDLSAKIRRVLKRRLNGGLKNGLRVRIERREFRDRLNVTVVSRRFSGTSLLNRNVMILEWLREDLELSERRRIGGLIAVTPEQDRRLFGNGG